MSAHFPFSREPISWSSPSAFAPSSVAIRSAEWTGRVCASPLTAFETSAASRSSSRMSSRLLLAAPSVPMPTLMPAESMSPSRANPLANFRLEAGQCATEHPCAASRAISTSSRWTACTAISSGPSKPSRRSRSSGRTPCCVICS